MVSSVFREGRPLKPDIARFQGVNVHKMGTRGSMNINMRTKNVSSSPSGIQVDVEVRDISPEIGKGLFALQNIPRGTLVWKVLHDLSNVQVFSESK